MNRITRADIADAAEILALQKLAYQSEAVIYNDWSIPPLTQTLADIEQEFAVMTILKLSNDSGKIIGSVRGALRGDTCEIGRLIVHPDSQGQGLGSRLMAAVEAEFPTVARYELFTGSKSVGNIRLYERLGYRTFRTERLSPQVELVFMEKITS
ncbi:putative acetyltransferase [Geobacter sp. OR-1]|uniref:GNAT family N-acetyltransferase n=1 Tax=Geobacter sp. OR-1 TaxID=1266765 RepID=UPI000543E0AB|nr:GNAT family N-acetyltransferase [Geobacter sp. OR-1]GAM10909.1 putative acetyltransferase [Geobacter sp. OR-1]